MDLSVEVTPQPDHVVVEVFGEVDVHTAPELRGALGQVIEAGNERIVLDLGGVEFLDSTGLGVLVAVWTDARDRGGWLRIVSTEERILKMFRITGLDQKFEIFDTRPDAGA
jgi:anti-sigma B factor antagonist